MNSSITHELLAALMDIKVKGPVDTGICGNVYLKVPGMYDDDDVMKCLHNLFLEWPEYSGNMGYPVASPLPAASCVTAFGYLELWTGEYGSARIRLLNFCIRKLESEVQWQEAFEQRNACPVPVPPGPRSPMKRVLSDLRHVKKILGAGHIPSSGICNYVLGGADEGEILYRLFESWPECSGSLVYPVDAPRDSPYHYSEAYLNLPRWTGEYGSSRIRLLNFCIRQLEARV